MPDARTTLFKTLELESHKYGITITPEVSAQLGSYYEMLNEWNPRLHLVAPCSPEEFARRHLLESLFALPFLNQGVTIIDIGSGAGLPIIPCLIARSDLRATLIESSLRKGVFLREALKRTGVSDRATVVAERFQEVTAVSGDVVMCRALERFAENLAELVDWSPERSVLLLYAGDSLRQKLISLKLDFQTHKLPGSKQRYLVIVERK